MNCHAPSTHFLLQLYGRVKRSGLLEIPLVKRAFRISYFLYKDLLEDPFKDLIRFQPQMFRNGNIIDVGANIGYTSLAFAKALSPEMRVFAFEPDSTNFKALEESVQTSRFKARVSTIQAAIGERDGSVELWINKDHHADHRIATEHFTASAEFQKSGDVSGQTVSVPMYSLDTFLLRENVSNKVSFIKIDVQGYELEVCLGMKEILRINPGVTVAFEYSPASMVALGSKAEHLLEFFRERNFKLYRLERGAKIIPFEDPSTEEVRQKRGYFDVLASPVPLISN